MKLFRPFLLLFTLALVSGCASQPASQAEEEDAQITLTAEAARVVEEKGEVQAAKAGTKESRKSDLVCESVKRTGSHMTETYCYTRSEAARDRAKLRQELDANTRGSELRDYGER